MILFVLFAALFAQAVDGEVCTYELLFHSCEDVMRGTETVPGLLGLPEVYDIKVEGEFELFFSLDNPSNSPMDFQQSFWEGFQHQKSTSISPSWASVIGDQVYKAVNKTGKHASLLQTYPPTTWGNPIAHEKKMTVEKHSTLSLYQRFITVTFKRTYMSTDQFCETNDRCMRVGFDETGHLLFGTCTWNGKLPTSVYHCDFSAFLLQFRFATECFSSETNAARREKDCPV